MDGSTFSQWNSVSAAWPPAAAVNPYGMAANTQSTYAHPGAQQNINIHSGAWINPNYQPLVRNQRAFQPFVKHVALTPPPGKARFYWETITQNAFPLYERGFVQYFEDLKQKPLKAAFIAAVTLGIGTAISMFSRHKKLVKTSVLLGLIGYPVISSLKQIPAMADGYKMVKEGNPTAGTQKFNNALYQLLYQIGQVYLKPLMLALWVVTPLLTLPKIIRPIANQASMSTISKITNWVSMDTVLRFILRTVLRQTEESGWVKWLEKTVYKPLTKMGDKLMAPLEAKIPFLRAAAEELH